MAKILYANWFAWSSSSHLLTSTTAGLEQVLNIKLAQIRTGLLPNAREGSIMMTDGKFVGFIAYIATNTATGPCTISVVRIPQVGGSYDYADEKVLGSVTIPAGETKCFYTDPDTSDGTREYFARDNLQFRLVKESGGGQIKDISILLGMDMDGGTLTGPYEPNFSPLF